MHTSRWWSSTEVSSLSGVQVMSTLYYSSHQDYAYVVTGAFQEKASCWYATGKIPSLRHVQRILGLEWTEDKAPFSSDRRPDVCAQTLKFCFITSRRLMSKLWKLVVHPLKERKRCTTLKGVQTRTHFESTDVLHTWIGTEFQNKSSKK
jgi:hypothetical protein